MKENMLDAIMRLLVNLPAMISSAELAFSGKVGSGEEKKKLVMTTIETGLSIAGVLFKDKITAKQSDAILENVSDLTDASVEIMNTVDLFKNAGVQPFHPGETKVK